MVDLPVRIRPRVDVADALLILSRRSCMEQGARVRQEFAGLRFTPGSLDKKTDALLAYACALMAG
jgi:hypothetical protein